MGASFVLTFYDFIGVIIPGSALLIGMGLLFDVGVLSALAVPKDSGIFAVHLIVAYVAGQLIQALGNWVELLYWRLWKGRPTDWPVTREKNIFGASTIADVSRFYNKGDAKAVVPKGQMDLVEWRQKIGYAVSVVTAEKQQEKMQIFNSLYSMFRGLFISFLIISITWLVTGGEWLSVTMGVLVVSGVLSVYSMHRFSRFYASELFSNVRRMSKKVEPAA